jgi:DNA-binding PadR family transcriptional regulator
LGLTPNDGQFGHDPKRWTTIYEGEVWVWVTGDEFQDLVNTFDGIPAHVVTSPFMELSLGELGHYAGPATLILSSLADGPKHGYALTQDIEVFSGVRLQPGTLYGAIQRLEQQGLIEPLAEEGRRRPYRMTAHGAVVLQVHLKAQRQVTEVGLQRLSIGWTVA